MNIKISVFIKISWTPTRAEIDKFLLNKRNYHKCNVQIEEEVATKLVCDEFRILFSPFDGKSWHIECEITDGMVAEITSNDQVDNETVFKD